MELYYTRATQDAHDACILPVSLVLYATALADGWANIRSSEISLALDPERLTPARSAHLLLIVIYVEETCRTVPVVPLFL